MAERRAKRLNFLPRRRLFWEAQTGTRLHQNDKMAILESS
jgi:hypothetical protein